MAENKKSRMYEVNGERVRTWNPFAGCKHECVYCYAREQAKRRKNKCDKCYNFEPHAHFNRLSQKFKAGETVFVCSMGDIAFASDEEFELILSTIEKYPKTTFMLQSKDPRCFLHHEYLTDNVLIGTTIETTKNTQELEISKAPRPIDRVIRMIQARNPIRRPSLPERYVTIEPVLDFDLDTMVKWMQGIEPRFVYVGYLNPLWKAKKLQLPEPPLAKVKELCWELAKFTEVRLKTIRKGWNEE